MDLLKGEIIFVFKNLMKAIFIISGIILMIGGIIIAIDGIYFFIIYDNFYWIIIGSVSGVISEFLSYLMFWMYIKQIKPNYGGFEW